MSALTAPVNRIIPFSLVDGPGSRSAVFLQGCNQTCLYCHNPETINPCRACGECVNLCPKGALSKTGGGIAYDIARCCFCDTCIKACKYLASPRVRNLTAAGTMALLSPSLPFVRGITVSGGECTLHDGYMAELFALARGQGKTCFVDTNGQRPFRCMPGLTEAMDAAMVDLKSASEEEHRMLTGKPLAPVLENIIYLAQRGKLFEIRTVVVPGLLDNLRNVKAGAALIAPYPGVRYKVIRYRPFGVREGAVDAPVPSDDLMEELEQAAREAGVRDIVVI